MLNLVPIQFLALFAYFILRVGIGVFWLYVARRKIHALPALADSLRLPIVSGYLAAYWIISFEIIIGVLFIVGLATQIAAILAATWCLKRIIFHHYFHHESFQSREVAFLLLISALSLFITGAGVFGFDLPI